MNESAVHRHDRMMLQEMEQAERVRTTADRPADFWQTLAQSFRLPPDPASDPVPDALAALIAPGDRVIDVGAGGGRQAIPLARRCREMTAVEPSPAMRAILAEEMAKAGIENIRVVAATWEEAAVEPAEVVYSAHVTYGIRAIAPFVRKLDATARRHAALVVMTDPPQSPLGPFWRRVHGEERLRLPCRDELLAVLRELGATPAVVSLGPPPIQSLGTREEALALLRFRLIVAPGTPQDARLLAVLDDLAVERDGLCYPRDARPNEQSLLHWTPGAMTPAPAAGAAPPAARPAR